MAKHLVKTPDAPLPIGPYSQGIRVGNFLFTAGQGPIDPTSGKIIGEGIQGQTERTLKNIKAILESSGFSLRDVVKVSIFLKSMSDFQKMNEVYKTFFPESPPARTTVQAELPGQGMLIEIDATAFRE